MRKPAAAPNALMVARCWRASSSVGAISAACAPASTARGHGEQRDHGLAAADIALQQTQHALRAREIGVDLGQRAGLRAGQLEGQGGEDRLAELAGSSEPPAGTPLEPRADDGKRKLIGEQLVISEPRPGWRRRQKIGFGLGRMQARKRLGERRPRLLRQEGRVRSIPAETAGAASASPIALRSVVLVRPAVSG